MTGEQRGLVLSFVTIALGVFWLGGWWAVMWLGIGSAVIALAIRLLHRWLESWEEIDANTLARIRAYRRGRAVR